MYCPEHDNSQFQLKFKPHQVETFGSVPQTLSNDTYYVPLATNFAVVDALTKQWGLQYTITTTHPIKGVEIIDQLAALYPNNTLNLLFIVPQSIASEFKKQPIVTTKGKTPKTSHRIKQFVAGIPLGIDTSVLKRRRVESEG
jgi:hypothetical protein